MSIKLERLSALEAEDLQRRAAGGLARAGLGPGQKLAFTLGSSKHLLCAVLAATRSAITPVMINAQLAPGEMAEQIADCDPQLVVDSEAQLAALFDAPSRELAPYPLTRPMHYSSGTTGKAKGIVTGIWDEATAKAVFADEADLWSFSPDDLHLLCSPMYHTVSIRFSAGTLLSGGSLLLMSKFDASTALESLRRDRPNTSFLVPTHLQRILSLPQLGSDEIFDSLRFLAHAGSACPPVLKYAAM
ncbi:MAG: AMP-binding protein, partial [Actinobacteria bacterium]|nr:AMP-binding protein [Actinomycetota bacterium]